MTVKDTSLDDIADSIAALATLIDQRFSEVDKRFIGLEDGQRNLQQQITDLQTGQYSLQAGQRETNECLDRVEGETKALRNDVKELYLLAH